MRESRNVRQHGIAKHAAHVFHSVVERRGRVRNDAGFGKQGQSPPKRSVLGVLMCSHCEVFTARLGNFIGSIAIFKVSLWE